MANLQTLVRSPIMPSKGKIDFSPKNSSALLPINSLMVAYSATGCIKDDRLGNIGN